MPNFVDRIVEGMVGRWAVVAALGVFNAALLVTWISPWPIRRVLPPENLSHESGFCYLIKLPVSNFWQSVLGITGDRMGAGYISDLRLFEDGREIGPAHSPHAGIREVGRGRYSHWGQYLYFSTSDNSDPSKARRVYEVHYPVSASPWLVVSGVAIFLVASLGLERAVRKIFLPVGFTVLGVGTFVLPFELVLRSDYSKLHWFGVYGTPPKHLEPTLNSKGYRDDEHRPGKVDDRLRILILGDSMTFGDSLTDAQIFPRLLAARLGPKVEIIAMGLDGWSTADQLAAFRREGLSYSPDIVVVAAYTNDLEPIATEPSGQQPDWVVLQRLAPSLNFFRFLDYHINRLGDLCGWRYSYLAWERDLFDPDKRYFSAWQATVREMSGVLNGYKIDSYIFVMIWPVAPSSPEQIRKYEILAATFADAGFNTVNLREAFVRGFGEAGGRHLWALPNDPHPGPAVNEFFAREMAKVLEPRVKTMLKERAANSRSSEPERSSRERGAISSVSDRH